MLQHLTDEERKLASAHHDLVYRFLEEKGLPEDVFYDVVIFGYLRAIQEYASCAAMRRRYEIESVCWQKMQRELSKYYAYQDRKKRKETSLSLEEPVYGDPEYTLEEVLRSSDELMEEFETELFLHELAEKLPAKEMRVIRMKLDGAKMHEISKEEHLSFSAIRQLLDRSYSTVLKVLIG